MAKFTSRDLFTILTICLLWVNNANAQFWPNFLSGAPTRSASNIKFVTGATWIEVHWTKGNGRNNIVTIRKATSPQSFPKDGILSTYFGSPFYGSGNDIGNGNYVIYNDFDILSPNSSAKFTQVVGLEEDETYIITVYEYNINILLPAYKYFDKGISATAVASYICPGVVVIPIDGSPWHAAEGTSATPHQIATDSPYGNVKANAYVYYGSKTIQSERGLLTKPLIFVEGVDFGESISKRQNGELGWCQLTSGTAEGYEALAKMPELLDSLHTDGYDIILLDFLNGSDDMKKNAMILVKLIDLVNEYKMPGAEQNVVIGASMGGVISRYALAYMEKNNMRHCTREFVSFDAPQKGANIPLGLQYNLSLLAEIDPVAKYNYGKLGRFVTKQLLYSNVHSGANENFRKPWMTDLAAVGYPQKLRKVAIANGSKLGRGQGFNAGDKLLEWNYGFCGANLIMNNVFAVGDHNLIYSGKFIDQGIMTAIKNSGACLSLSCVLCNIHINLNADIHSLTRFLNQNSPPYDNAPGGYRKTAEDIHKGFLALNLSLDDTPAKLFHGRAAFVPTISALDINTDDLFFDVKNGDILNNRLTPFEDFYAPDINQEHIEIDMNTGGNGKWLLDELRNGTNLLKSPLVNNTFNYGRPQTKILNTMTIGNGGKLYTNANLKTDYLTGIIPLPGSTLNMFTSDCGAYIKVENGGQLILGDNSTGNKAILRITAGSKLHLTNGSKLVINDNSQLIVEPGAIFIHDLGATIELNGAGSLLDIQMENFKTAVAVGKTFKITKGTATEGGTLKIADGEFALLAGGGISNLIIDGCKFVAGPKLKLRYETGANIQLVDTKSQLEIQGQLSISPNANFTFKGNGFVKFNHTSTYPSTNIIAGTNARMTFKGSGKNNKVLEIVQETLYAPDLLAEFSVADGTIAMGGGARLQPGGKKISFTNTRVTSTSGIQNSHRGLTIYGQPGVTIDNCDFENGKYGVYAWLSYGGAALKISNSTFKNCDQGLFSHDKGIDLDNVVFEKCTTGWNAEAMSFPGSAIRCMANENSVGINYGTGAGADLKLDGISMMKNSVSYNTPYFHGGIEMNGSAKLTIQCGNITNNSTAISITNNAELDLSSYKTNNITNNDLAILISFAKNFYLNEGSNNLISNKGLVIAGDMYLDPSQKGTVTALGNSWNTLRIKPEVGVHHLIRDFNNGAKYINIDDLNPNGVDHARQDLLCLIPNKIINPIH